MLEQEESESLPTSWLVDSEPRTFSRLLEVVRLPLFFLRLLSS
jgi:hypothetical protein